MTKVGDPKAGITRFQLCCGVQGCPIVEIHHDLDKVVITDDSGGKVTLTEEQWREALTRAKVDA